MRQSMAAQQSIPTDALDLTISMMSEAQSKRTGQELASYSLPEGL